MEAEDRITQRTRRRGILPTVSEVILENFMSYEYGRIPLRKGINIIMGPNGAGKSTILLALSVALGQVYTERSRKLSDLIRRGKEIARVSLLFDNKPHNGRRPIPFSKADTFMLSRYMKSDGTYWYEADHREISKSEVARLLRQFGINPDNLLIIMHQGMIEEFTVTSAQEKLRMVEEAVGFQEYREGITESQHRLASLVTEETEMAKTMEDAGQSLDYWKQMYGKFVERKQLLERKQFLEREHVWSQVIKLEKTLQSLGERLENRKNVLADVMQKIGRTQEQAKKASSDLEAAQLEQKQLYSALVRQEREKATGLARIESSVEKMDLMSQAIKMVEESLALGSEEQVRDLRKKIEEVQYRVNSISAQRDDLEGKKKYQEQEIASINKEITKNDRDIQSIFTRYVDLRVDEALLGVRRDRIEREITDLERSVKENQEELNILLPQSETAKPRIETERQPADVLDELKITEAHIRSLGEIPADAETIYTKFAQSYAELKDRLAMLAENKTKTGKELDERKKIWKETLQNMVEQINPVYQDILAKINASGIVRLIEMNDMEKSGLELLVGFRGAPMVVLDAYTQSGGERGVSVMAFLLSLQQRVLSPFRAVDEFDVHLDPKNREAVLKMIFSYIRESTDSQYIVITPAQLTVMEKDVHLIFVQNVYGKSAARTRV